MKKIAISIISLAMLGAGSTFAADQTGTTDHTRVFHLQAPPTNPAWDDAVKTVTAMLPQTARLVSQPATGSLAVTADDATLLSVDHYVQSINAVLSQWFSVALSIFTVNAADAPAQGILLTDASPRDILERLSGPDKLLDYHTMYAVTSNGTPVQKSLITEQDYPVQVQVANVADNTTTTAKVETGTRFSVTPHLTDNGIAVRYSIVSSADGEAGQTPTIALDGEYLAKDGQTIELTSKGKAPSGLSWLFGSDKEVAVIVALSVKQIHSVAINDPN